MSIYKEDLELEIKAANKKVELLIEDLKNSGGTKSPDFMKKWSDILSMRQSIQAKQQRANNVGKPRESLPQIISIEQFIKP